MNQGQLDLDDKVNSTLNTHQGHLFSGYAAETVPNLSRQGLWLVFVSASICEDDISSELYGHLTSIGVDRAQGLADKIQKTLGERQPYILTSTDVDAYQTALTIADTLGVEPVQVPVFKTEGNYSLSEDAKPIVLDALSLRSQTTDTIILVGGRFSTADMAKYYLKHRDVKQTEFMHNRGDCVLVDAGTGVQKRIAYN
jgi:phosphohistidine phosphatase SixA